MPFHMVLYDQQSFFKSGIYSWAQMCGHRKRCRRARARVCVNIIRDEIANNLIWDGAQRHSVDRSIVWCGAFSDRALFVEAKGVVGKYSCIDGEICAWHCVCGSMGIDFRDDDISRGKGELIYG